MHDSAFLLSRHHVRLPVFSVWHRRSKHWLSQVCSQHASCAYMWIILATEQCSSTWPVSWNIPHCDPSEASHPTATPLPLPPRWDPEECPRGSTEQTTVAANFGFSSQTSHQLWDYVIVLFISSEGNVLFFPLQFHSNNFFARCATGTQHNCCPQLFLKPFVFWSVTVCYSCLSAALAHTISYGEVLGKAWCGWLFYTLCLVEK